MSQYRALDEDISASQSAAQFKVGLNADEEIKVWYMQETQQRDAPGNSNPTIW